MSKTTYTSLTLPATGFLRQSAILAVLPISKTTLWRWVSEGNFPAPLKLSPKVTVWPAESVHAFLEAHAPKLKGEPK
jgi:prophage regulatory protein